MIRTISWPQFGFFLVGASAVYYFGFGLVYYRKKLLRRLVKPKGDNGSFTALSTGDQQAKEEKRPQEEPPTSVLLSPAGSLTSAGVETAADQEPDLYPIANELVETLDDFIVKAGKSKHVKEEVLFGIRVLIGKYPVLHATGFKAAISNYVGIALRDNCSFELNEVEKASLWVK